MKKIESVYLGIDQPEEAIQSAIKSLKADAYIASVIQSLSLSEEEIQQHLSTLLHMQEDHQEIAQCMYQKTCIKPKGHYEVTLKRNAGGYLERHMAPCPMLASQLTIHQYLLYDDFPDTWKDGALFLDVGKRQHRVELSKILNQYLLRFSTIKTKNMYVFGPPRTGKSFSLATFAYKFALNEVGTIGVIEAPSFSQRLLDLSNNEPTVFTREIDQLKRLDILIIDRLGDESVLDKSRDQVWIPLLQDRLHQQKATMMISSFTLEDLLTLYTVFPNQKPKAKQFIELIKTFEYQLFIPPATPL